MSSRVNLLLFTVDPTQVKVANDHLKLAIARHNQWPRSKLQVRDTTIGDFRDIAAAWVYRNSRYSVWVTMLFLDHKQMSTTRGYLDTQAARQESHAAVKSVMDDVFEQIVVTRTWDAALTRAKVEGIDVSDGDKSRLNWYRSQRTYDGSVCEDHFNPPRNIDPANPRNGKVRCIQGHRCVASRCPLAKVFNESLPWIARRAAELEWQEEQTGMVRFSVSTDESDLEELRRTLKQWPEKEVEKELKHWLDRLRDGTHRPLRIAGQH
ncbi:hypothetical protein GCM10007863_45350 [Dyella mobilis]|nr:hypothetical protein GCM10007863_45350 [Dyella mobilis]